MREKENLYCRLYIKPYFDVRCLLMREINTTYYFMKDIDYNNNNVHLSCAHMIHINLNMIFYTHIMIDRFYIALLSALEQTHCSRM